MESLRDARLEGVRDVGLASALPARVGDLGVGGKGGSIEEGEKKHRATFRNMGAREMRDFASNIRTS